MPFSPEQTDWGTEWGGDPDILAATLARTLEQFKEKPRYLSLLTIIGERNQKLSTALGDIYFFRGIDKATTAQLDLYGGVLNLAREGRNNAEYRRALKTWILLLISDGTIGDILAIGRAFFGAAAVIEVQEYQPAAFTFRVVGSDLAGIQEAAEFICEGSPLGVMCRVETYQESGTFGFDGDPTALGFGEVSDPTAGGVWGEATG